MEFPNDTSVLSLTGSDGIVRTSGKQTIRGVKTFKDDTFFGDDITVADTIECSRLNANFIWSKSPADYFIIQSNTSTAWTAGTTFTATAGGDMLFSSNTGSATLEATLDNVNINSGLDTTMISLGFTNINATNGIELDTSLGNINFTADIALQHNSKTFNPRRQYNLNYSNGANTLYYGLEIIKAENDPNNTLSPAPTNSKTYIEIIPNGALDAAYNGSRLSGYFIGAGNSDSVSQSDFMCSTYNYLEPMFGPIYTGSSSTSYTSFVFYLIGGFNYRIITDGVIGNYWNNITTGPLFERWALTNNTTYNTGATATFAIAKNTNYTDFLGTTASTFTLAIPASFLDSNIYDYTTNRANKFKITDSKLIAAERYIAAAGASTAIPIVSFTKVAVRVGGTSNSQLNWGIDAVNTGLITKIPFKCRCVGVDVAFDNDATPPTVLIRFQVYLGNANGVGTATYLDTGSLITVATTDWSTTTGWAESTATTQQPVIAANAQIYGSWECKNASTLALVTLNQEFVITFYFQQIP